MRWLLKYGGWMLTMALLASPTAAHVDTTVITITAEGFSPREVTVDTNAVVRFVNNNTGDHWPASNIHPTHDEYPEFDPALAIPPGDSWFFQPKRAGTWTYHDHLFPHRRGTLRVVAEAGDGRVASDVSAPPPELPEPTRWTARLQRALSRLAERVRQWSPRRPKPAALSPEDFQNLPEKERYAHVHALFRANGPGPTWEFVQRAYTNDQGASLGGHAHDLAHFFGGLVWKARGLKGISSCDPTFAFGCYHGFTEAAFVKSLDRLPDVARACERIGAKNSGPWASCIHGIGHGVATYHHAQDLQSALAACDTLALGATYCHDGVFMEFSFSAAPSFYRKDDPLYPCGTLEARYQQACARNQPHVMRRAFGMDRRAIATACLAAPPTIADPCIDTLGFALANESQGSANVLVTGCRELPTSLAQAKCVSAAAGELVFQNLPNWQMITRTVCGTLPPEFQPGCQQRVQETSQNYRR